MRRTLSMICLVVALVILLAPVALAQSQPTSGDNSADRNAAAVFGGPHCHVNLVASENQDAWDEIWVFPSHNAHVQTGLSDGVFAAISPEDCPDS